MVFWVVGFRSSFGRGEGIVSSVVVALVVGFFVFFSVFLVLESRGSVVNSGCGDEGSFVRVRMESIFFEDRRRF